MGLQDGWGQEDTWNLVPLLLGGISVAGIGKSLTAAKATSRATSSTGSAVDDAVRSASKSATTVGGKCFVAGTEILTTEGEKSIEDIQVGDWVIADDPTTPGEIEARQVLETFVRHTDKLVDLYIDGEVISTTGEHPFWTPDKGWVEAKDLEVGSLLQTEDGRIIDVDKIEKREGDFTVYNFKVEGFHTYFVSDLSILVHNANCPGNFRGLDNEDIYTGTFPTSKGDLEIAGEVEIDGNTLHLKQLSIFPVEGRRSDVGTAEMRKVIDDLKQQAKDAGFEKLRITGTRVSGSSYNPASPLQPGRKIDRTFDL